MDYSNIDRSSFSLDVDRLASQLIPSGLRGRIPLRDVFAGGPEYQLGPLLYPENDYCRGHAFSG